MASLLAHVTVYHLVMAVMLAVTAALLDLPISWAGAAAGNAFSAVFCLWVSALLITLVWHQHLLVSPELDCAPLIAGA
ncbi:hypothetical protein ADK70_31510 [Streptomyces rimosus subsp. pseudoverticillatus]|uniref:hypothetical protein n=1 Tax=Streptomyces rimosus TaxID=1927 RepID=UPI0006B265C5|nr:hypothetical protein [Streptomyces rimosus]KOT79206.1 hypothetical protein ADK70_31510 [Streptomyces rimosus subsp. pseudoverticillatus]